MNEAMHALKEKPNFLPRGMLLALALLFFLTSEAFAASLKFAPMSVLLDSEHKRQSLKIINNGDEGVSVQLQMMKWIQDEKGNDVFEPTKDIVFYPQITTIAAGKEGTVRIGYEKPIPFSREGTYRLFVQELPVNKSGENVVKVALRVGLPVFITPKNPLPQLSCGDVGIVDGKLQVTITNSGNAHSLIQRIRITGRDDAGAEAFSKEQPGWYVLSGVSKAFPLSISPEECRKASVIEIVATAGNQNVKGQFHADEASCAQLAESDGKGKLDMDALPPPKGQ